MAHIRLLLVESHTLFRDSVLALLREQADLVIAGEAAGATMAVGMAEELRPDVVLMDAGLADSGAVDATRQILARHPEQKIIALSAAEGDDGDAVEGMVLNGATGFVRKEAIGHDLVHAIRTVAAGGAAIDPYIAAELARQFRDLPRQRKD